MRLSPGTGWVSTRSSPRWAPVEWERSFARDTKLHRHVALKILPGNKRRTSSEGGLEPAWAREGRKLLFLSPTTTAKGPRQRIMEVDETLAPTFSAGAPRVVVDLDGARYSNAIGAPAWDLTADAQRFVLVHETNPPATDPMDQTQIVQNWHEELRRRVGEVARS